MKLAHAKSVVHHTAVETEKLERLKQLQAQSQNAIDEMNKLPSELKDKLENAEAELSLIEEQRTLLTNTIADCERQLRNLSGRHRLQDATHQLTQVTSQIKATEKRLATFSRQLTEAQSVIISYEAKEVDRLANQIVDGALLMDELEGLTEDQRKDKMKQIRHDKRVESQKEKGRHYHRMIRRKTGNTDEDVVMVPCHGRLCQFCPPAVAKV